MHIILLRGLVYASCALTNVNENALCNTSIILYITAIPPQRWWGDSI